MSDNIKKAIKISSLFVIVVLIIPFIFGCLSDPAVPYYSSGSDRTDQLGNTITVTGNGSHKVVPDKAMINISVFIEDETSEVAVDKNSNTTANVIEALENLEIEDIKIQTISFNLDPLYNYRRENDPPEVYAYKATTIMEVSTNEITAVGEIISKSIEAGANDVSSLSFGLSDDLAREAKKTALDKAAKDGRDKANDIAESLEIEIVGIYYISESETYIPAPFNERLFSMEESLKDIASVPVTPNEVEVTATVQISYIFR